MWWCRFSTENWKRAEEENTYLFNLLRDFVKRYKKKFLAEKIRFFHLGRKDRIPQDIIKALNESVLKDADTIGIIFPNYAFNAPHIVNRFFKQLDQCNNKINHYFLF